MAKSHVCWSCGNNDPKRATCTSCDGTGFDTENTDVPVCPYCGAEMSTDDLYESETRYCATCEHDVAIEIEYTPSYTTTKGDKIDVERAQNARKLRAARIFVQEDNASTATYCLMSAPITRDEGLLEKVVALREANGPLVEVITILEQLEAAFAKREAQSCQNG